MRKDKQVTPEVDSSFAVPMLYVPAYCPACGMEVPYCKYCCECGQKFKAPKAVEQDEDE